MDEKICDNYDCNEKVFRKEAPKCKKHWLEFEVGIVV